MPISYRHRVHARARHLKISLHPNGEIIVTTPPRVPTSVIDRFVQDHQDWIARQQQRLPAAANPEQIKLFGKSYRLVETSHPDQHPGVSVTDHTLTINHLTLPKVPTGRHLSSAGAKQLERYLKQTAEKYIVPRTHQWGAKMAIEFAKIQLREQKSRWGSCSSRGTLNFNWRLVHHPPAVIDYVIIHELAHRRQMNHSAAFWNIVRQFDPAYAQHKGYLHRHGQQIS